MPFHSDAIIELLQVFALGEAGALWLFLLIAFLVAGDLARLRSSRNVALLLLALPALPLINIMNWERHLDDPELGWLLGAAFTALFVATAFMAAWALALAMRRSQRDRPIGLSLRQLKFVLGFVLLMNALVVLARNPEDSGPYSSLGAQRWLETGTMPYGDPKLRGPTAPGYGAAATYGPLLFVAHMPFNLLTGAKWNSPDLDPMSKAYVRPRPLATKLTCLAFHLVGLWALYGIGRRLGDQRTGLALAALYAASPYVMGLGGQNALITGLPFISHIAPPAMMLVALRFIDRPALSGACLAGAAGLLFYPAFFAPLFLGWFVWRRAGARRFVAGFGLSMAAIVGLVILFTGSIGEAGPVELVLQSTLEHQEGTGVREYGASKFSFWGTHPDLAAVWQRPLFGRWSIFKPTFLLFLVLCASAFFLAKGRTLPQLALLVAALAAAIQLWKTHAGGTYVEWYLPFLLIGLLGAKGRTECQARFAQPQGTPAEPRGATTEPTLQPP